MKIVGLDIASKTGAVTFTSADTDLRMVHVPTVKDGDRMKRWHAYGIYLRNLCDGAELVVIEDYAPSRFPNSSIPLIEMGAIIRKHLWEGNIRYIEVPPKTLKKFVTGNGNAKKKQMVAVVNARWDQSITDDNIADAFGLAKIGEVMLGKRTPDELMKLREKYHTL